MERCLMLSGLSPTTHNFKAPGIELTFAKTGKRYLIVLTLQKIINETVDTIDMI